MAEQRILVTVHNIVNVPADIKTLPGTTLAYELVLATDSPNCPQATATFSKSSIGEANGHLEVSFETSANPSAVASQSMPPVLAPSGSQEWILSAQARNVEATVSVSEKNTSSGSVRELGARAPIRIDIAQVLKRKVITRIVGTSTGQVGLSFSVSKNDMQGYRSRLEAFLQQHNPAGLKLLDTVTASVSEIETFNKVYKKYGIENYEKRVMEFFQLYGPAHLAAVPSTMKEWENREEELIRNLVLDNGPEPRDIDFQLRLLAFIEKYNIADLNITELLEAHGSDPSQLFSTLVSQHGPEPDPRTYLYPAVVYAHNEGESAAPAPEPQPQAAAPAPTEPMVTAAVSPQRGAPPRQRPSPAQDANPVAKPAEASQQQPQRQQQSAPVQQQPPAQATRPTSVQPISWDAFCRALRDAGVAPSEVFFLDESSFTSTVAEMGYSTNERAALTELWRQRTQGALRQNFVSTSDPQFEAVKRELIALSGMSHLSLQVMGVMSLDHTEHATAFQGKLAAAKERTVERFLRVGDYNELLRCATIGFSPSPLQVEATRFYRKPFRNIDGASTLSVLVCDVVVGRSSTLTAGMVPPEPTREFYENADSFTVDKDTSDEAVGVFQPQQIQAKYLVHLSVDPSVIPCQTNPNRPVEYFVVDDGSFVCSQCVVTGKHRGSNVLSIDDAALQSRTKLADMSREMQQIHNDVASAGEDVERSLQLLDRSELMQEALRQAEQIRREAEARATEVLKAAERQQDHQRAGLLASKQQISQAELEVSTAQEQVQKSINTRGATETIRALLSLQQRRVLESARTKAEVARGVSPSATQHAASQPNPSPSMPPQHQPGFVNNYQMPSLQQQQQQVDAAMAHYQQNNGGQWASARNPSASQVPETSAAALGQTGVPLPDPSSNDLYAKFSALKGATPNRTAAPTAMALSRQSAEPANVSAAVDNTWAVTSAIDQQRQLESEHLRHSKEQMTRGWAAFRTGNRAEAQRLWTDIFERHNNHAIGARARAYLAEAIENDYQAASTWYEKALAMDPKDCMTLFNYAVLLESVLGRKREALTLFETAQKLGDHTAGRRAQVLRSQI